MSESEIMTIIIAFHMSHHRDFKNFYLGLICRYYRNNFPTLLSYTRFLEVMPSVLIPLSSFFTHVKESRLALSSSTQRALKCVISCAYYDIKSSKALRQEGKEQWAGFTVLNFTLLPTTLVI